MLWFGALAGAIVLSIIAVIYHLDQMFFVAVTLGAAPWLSWRLTDRGMTKVRAELQSTGTVRLSVGEECVLRVMLYNHGRMPKLLCRARLALPRGLVEEQGTELQADTLAPGATVPLDVRFRGHRRGVYAIREAEIRTTDQLGIFEFPARVPDVAVDVIVWPRQVPVRGSRWLGSSLAMNGIEQASTNRKGSGLEFFGVREWSPGDDLRRVHWPSTARRGSLTVVEFERHAARNLTLILDLGVGRHTGTGDTSSLEWCVSFAATLASLAVREGGSVGLVARGAADFTLCSPEGILEAAGILDRLAAVRDGCPEPLDRVVSDHLDLVRQTRTLVLTPRADATVGRAVRMLMRSDCDVSVLLVSPEQQTDGALIAGLFRPGVDDPATFLERGGAR